MFSSAKKVAAVPTAARTAPAKVTETIDGLEEIAALDACFKAIKGLLDLKKDAAKAEAVERLLERGLARKSKPDGLSLAEGDYATGKISISKRAVSSPLAADELEILAEAVGSAERDEDGAITAIPGFAETVEKQPAMLTVNPAYGKDEMLLARIDKALSGVKGIPEDFILSLPAQQSVVVTETATDAVFRLAPEAAELVFPLIGGVTMSATYKDVEKAWAIVKPLLTEEAASKPARKRA